MMINLTHDECIAVIKVSELMRERFDTLSLKQVKQQVGVSKIELQNTPYDFKKGE